MTRPCETCGAEVQYHYYDRHLMWHTAQLYILETLIDLMKKVVSLDGPGEERE